jgi:hypothetical protein
MNKRIIELADKAVEDISSGHWNIPDEFCKKFAALVAAHEREAIAQMFEGAPALVQFAQNDKGGCLICGFTPKLVIETIRARGEA